MAKTQKGKEDKEIINTLAGLIKTSQLHSLNNIAVTNAIKKLSETLDFFLSEEPITLELVGEFFHLSGSRIRFSTDTIFNYNFLINEFKSRELGSITFREPVREDNIKILLSALNTSGNSQTPFERLSEDLEKAENIGIIKLRMPEVANEFDRKKIVKKAYLNAVTLTKNISNQIASGEKISIKKTKRVMEVIVDQIVDEEHTLIGMTTIKDYDEYTYFHSVNVSILSLALGQRLGISKKTLTELGMAALFHDMGKVEVPKEILNKPREFNEEDWEIIHRHPAWGACQILKIKGINTFSINAAIAAFEHHLNYDLSGYPKLKNTMKLDFFSRIITIADNYDAMTSARVYSRVPLSPDKALSVLLDKSTDALDPYLTKIFISMIGVFPIGSLVMLDTHEFGLVFESNTNQNFKERPRVYIIIDKDGNRTKNTVDLMEKDEQGNFKRNIIRTLDPNEYNVNLAEYLL